MNTNMTRSEFKRHIEGVSLHPIEWDEEQPEPKKRLDFDEDESDEDEHDYNECDHAGECEECCKGDYCTSKNAFCAIQGQYECDPGLYCPCTICEPQYCGNPQPVIKDIGLGIPGYPGEDEWMDLVCVPVAELVKNGLWSARLMCTNHAR